MQPPLSSHSKFPKVPWFGNPPCYSCNAASLYPLPTKVHTSSTFSAKLRYPAHWQQLLGQTERYGAPDGFFQLSALSSGGNSLDQVTAWNANHPLSPYGSIPFIYPTLVHGFEARFMFPSADQSANMNNQAALILQILDGIENPGQSYDYLILWADTQHIVYIVRTLRLLKGGVR